MSASASRSRPDAGTSGTAGRGNAEEPKDYGQGDGKASITKSDAARLISMWLDQVYEDSALPASAFKLAYRIAKRCRATFAKQSTLFSFEGQEGLAASASISEKQVRNLLKMLAERGHLRVVQIGKKKTNRMFPIIRDRQSSSGHIEADDRQPVSGQSDAVTGNTVPSDRKSSSDMTGNGLPIHIDEGLSRRVEDERGEGFQPSPSLHTKFTNSNRYDQNQSFDEDDTDARQGASGHDQPMLSKGDRIKVGIFGTCIVDDFGLIGRSRWVKARRSDNNDRVFVPANESDRLMINDAMYEPEFLANYRADEVRWVDTIDCPIPRMEGRSSDAA